MKKLLVILVLALCTLGVVTPAQAILLPAPRVPAAPAAAPVTVYYTGAVSFVSTGPERGCYAELLDMGRNLRGWYRIPEPLLRKKENCIKFKEGVVAAIAAHTCPINPEPGHVCNGPGSELDLPSTVIKQIFGDPNANPPVDPPPMPGVAL